MLQTNNEYKFPIGPYPQNRGPARFIIRFNRFAPAELRYSTHPGYNDHLQVHAE